MTKEEAREELITFIGTFECPSLEAIEMAIEALEGAEINCVHCPRYFETEDETGVYSHCEDLISRAEAIEAIELVDWYHQNSNKDMVHGANDDEHQAWYKADDVYKALEAIPSVDKQRNGDLISRAEAIEALRYAQHRFTVADEAGGMGSVKWSEDVIYFAAAERVLTELPSADRPRPIDPTCAVDLESGVVPRSACEPRGPKTIIYADRIYSERPKGRWHYSDGKPATIGQSFGVICDQCGTESEYCTNFCGECGADMRGGTE